MHINEEAGNHYGSRNELKGTASSPAPGFASPFLGKLVGIRQESSTTSSPCLLLSSHLALSAKKFVSHCAE